MTRCFNSIPRLRMRLRLLCLLCCLLIFFPAIAQKAGKTPKLLSWSQQIAVREQWLAKRHEMILPMMREHGIDMWIVVNEEFHDDPLTQYIAPRVPMPADAIFSCSSIRVRKGCAKLPSPASPRR